MKPSTIAEAKEAVRDYWQGVPCGTSLTTAQRGSKQFFDEIEQKRYRLEPFIPTFAEFERWRDKRVLEIGVGVGTDFVRFARAGAKVSGIDLTDTSIELVHQRLALEGLRADLRVADAEQLPFADKTFDFVYSWGVLHHTPNTGLAVREAIRVLRPGGAACVMMYARHSWVSYALWVRHALLAGRPRRSLSEVLAHHIESQGTKGFTRRELRDMFAGLQELRVQHVGTPYDRRIVGPAEHVTGSILGWFIVVRGRVPQTSA